MYLAFEDGLEPTLSLRELVGLVVAVVGVAVATRVRPVRLPAEVPS